jgi:uncharacterized protein (TIGR03437 family)
MWSNLMNHYKISMFGTMLCLMGLGFSDTAVGQITTVPALSSGMAFQVQSGGATANQTLDVYTPNATTIVVTVPAGQSWLTVNGNPQSTTFFPNTPGGSSALPLTVAVNTSGLSNGQLVSANIVMEILNVPSSQVTFTVSLTVGTPSSLVANPANITFSAVTGNSFGSPTSVPVTISTTGQQALSYNVSVSTTNGVTWLLLTNTTGTTNSTSAGFSVSVNPQSLSVGSYTGTITVQSAGNSTTIAVTLSVTQGAALNVTPSSLNNFAFQSGSLEGSFQPQTQNIMISTSSGSLNYSISPCTQTVGGCTAPTGPVTTTNWLVINPEGGLATTTPQTVGLSLSFQGVSGLPVGTYGLTLAIAPTAGAGNTTYIPVTLVVSNHGLLTVNNSSLSFSLAFGSSVTQSQSVQVTSSNGSSVPYSAQASALWLSVLPTTGNTANNSVLTITANASGLAVQSTPYTGTVTLYPQNGDNYTVVINVQLTVTGQTSVIYAAPATLLFSYQTTQNMPGLQLVQLESAAPVSFTVSAAQMNASNCPTSNWISLETNQSVTPATLSVGIVTTGMTSGFCTGTITVTYNNGSSANTTVNIPVTVDIASTPLLTITPDNGFGVVTATVGSSAVQQSRISVGSTDGSSQGYTAFASTPNSPVSWLSLGNSQGTTQEYITIFVVPTGLPVGVYTGSVTINPTSGATLPSGAVTIPVVLTISANTTVSVSPTSLTFTQTQGGTAPAAQTLTLTASGGSTGFTASVTPVTGGTWLQVSPTSGTASASITATVLSSASTLSVGSYTSNITITFVNSATPSITIPVTLSIVAAQTVTVAPTSLSFSYQVGSAAPATQTLNLTSTGGAVPVTISASSTPAWLSVSPASGSTGTTLASPLVVTVTVSPTSLTAATYNGTITITPTGQAAISVPVTLTVSGLPMPQPGTIANSASLGYGPIAPGELITIKGANLGPLTPASFSVGNGGTLNNTLSGVQVLFDGIPGTPIYVSATQINAIVPYEIGGRSTTNVVVSYNSQQSLPISESVASQAPGIYTDTSNGTGQASVTNQNGTLNGPSAGVSVNNTTIATSPAPEGSVIAVYMTGGGQTNPTSSTGTVTPGGSTLYNIPGTVTATINGVNAPVQFAGAAPGLVTGVIQVNIKVPTGISGNTLPLAITINGTVTLSGPTVAVQ